MEKEYVNRINELDMPSYKRVANFYTPDTSVSGHTIRWIFIASAVLTLETLMATDTSFNPLIQMGFADGETNNTLLTYLNSTYGVTIKYPSNWGVQSGINKPSDTVIDVADISPPIALDPNAVANFQIGTENLEPTDTKNLDLYLRNAINAYRFNATDFHIDLATTADTQLAGKPAYVLVFSDTFNGFPMKTMVMGTFDDKHPSDNNGRFYYVQYTAEASRYDQLLPAVHQMINLFELSDSAENIMHVTNTTEVGSSS